MPYVVLPTSRLATDPYDSDSDGDGIADGNDALPQVPIGPASDFVVGDRTQFSSVDLDRRFVILTRAELELYERKFGHALIRPLGDALVRPDGQ